MIINRLFMVAFISLVISGGCIFDEKHHHHKKDHFHAEGIVLVESGVRFFKMFRGDIDTSKGMIDTLIAPVGLTPKWEIRFLDKEGNEIAPPDDSEKIFGWVITDHSIVEVYRHEGEEWEFHLKGLKVGETHIEFRVMHFDHFDFRTLKIPVSVRNHSESG